MKKKIILVAFMVAMLVCLFAISVSADETINGVVYALNSNGTARLTAANQSCELESVIIPEKVTGANGIEYTVTEIYSSAFLGNTNIKYLSLPATITKIAANAFKECTSLQLVDFNNNLNNVDFNNCGHFSGCISLKAVSLPKNVTILNNGLFTGCTELEVVYLPEKLEQLNGNKYNDGPFKNCNKVYLTSEQFDVENFATNGLFDVDKFNKNKPKKEDVYFFPSNLSSMGNTQNSPVFEYCTNINPVLILPTTYAGGKSGDGDLINLGTESSPKKIVFLGNMSTFNANTQNNRQDYTSYYFMNPDDKSPLDIGYKNSYVHNDSINGYMHFCAEGSYYQILKNSTYSEKATADTHVANPNLTLSTDATCTENVKETKTCFCGVEIGATEVDNTALGHIHSIFMNLVYTNYSKDGYYSYKCERCDDISNDKVAPALFTCLGYSAPEDGRGGIAIGFTVNNEAIAEYDEISGKTLKYGVFAVLQSRLGDNDIFGKDGTQAEGSIIAEISSYKFASFELKITGFETNEHKALKLAMGAYAAVTDGETTEYSYMQSGEPNENEKYCFVSYNDIVGTPSTDEEVTQ